VKRLVVRLALVCLAGSAVILLGLAGLAWVGKLFEPEPRAVPSSPVGTFDFTIHDGWTRAGPPEGHEDWHLMVVCRSDHTIRYEWRSLRDPPPLSGSLEGTWREPDTPNVGSTSRHWYLRTPGRPEPVRDSAALTRRVTDEVSWYEGTGWLVPCVDLVSGRLLDAVWIHRRDPRP